MNEYVILSHRLKPTGFVNSSLDKYPNKKPTMTDHLDLDDMLAELEDEAGRNFTDTYSQDVDNIDDFLDQIEEEARSSRESRNAPQPTRSTAASVSRPQQGRPQSTMQPQSRPQSTMQPQSRPQSTMQGRPQSTMQQQPQSRPQSTMMQQQGRPQQAQSRPQSTVVQPQQGRPQSTVVQNQSRPPAQSNARPAQQQARPQSTMQQRPASQSNARPQSKAPSVDLSNGDQRLRSDGFEPHLNRGKWYNYAGGQATDFRIKGTTSTRVGLIHAITLRSLDDNGNPASIDNHKEFIGCVFTNRNTGDDVPCWSKDNGDSTYDLAFFAKEAGTIRLEIKLCGNPFFDLDIHVEGVGKSMWAAKPRGNQATPGQLFFIDIETEDGSRPEGVAPFEVQTMGDVEGLKLINNGDGTYKFQCIPQSQGFVTIQISLHDQPIKNSPVTIQVGSKQPIRVKQESSRVDTISDDRYKNQGQPAQVDDGYGEEYQDQGYGEEYDQGYDQGGYDQGYGEEYGEEYYDQGYDEEGGYDAQAGARESVDVSNDDLNRLLDELGG
eukprot:TRINITY_DN5202_c0_g1_i1.p2 TRINITY_DN5202_c0_g1~~TRINITY_DN5202_c0_g1_i1.p2  ORF type:complete len:549 (-),score=147.06 TRINITY_DN5202_c0_g1_i1:122-1768(-)